TRIGIAPGVSPSREAIGARAVGGTGAAWLYHSSASCDVLEKLAADVPGRHAATAVGLANAHQEALLSALRSLKATSAGAVAAPLAAAAGSSPLRVAAAELLEELVGCERSPSLAPPAPADLLGASGSRGRLPGAATPAADLRQHGTWWTPAGQPGSAAPWVGARSCPRPPFAAFPPASLPSPSSSVASGLPARALFTGTPRAPPGEAAAAAPPPPPVVPGAPCTRGLTAACPAPPAAGALPPLPELGNLLAGPGPWALFRPYDPPPS
ncbi:unnamed protein product, partial [Prorocentrum cordatum]